MNQTGPRRFTRQKTALALEGLPTQELLEQGLSFANGDHGAPG